MSAGLFEREGIRFQYPENWTLQEQTAELKQLAVSVESPLGGFWSLQCLGSDSMAEGAAEQAMEAMREEYEQFEANEIEEIRHGMPMVGFNLDFYCLDLVVQAHLRAFEAHGQTYMLMYQAEDREFEELEAVFAAITLTMLQSLIGE